MNRKETSGAVPGAPGPSETPSVLDAAALARTRSAGFTRVRNAALIAGVSAYALMLGPVASDPAPNAASFSQTTAGAIAATVPDGSCAMAVSATGGSGGSSGTTALVGGRGAGGAIIGATFRVLPGQSVTGAVGGGGVSGGAGGTGAAAGGAGGTIVSNHRGGGGGGSSSISVAGQKLIEAGGGGGGGGAHQAAPAGDAGAGGFSPFAAVAGGFVAIGATGSDGSPASGVGRPVGGQGGQTGLGGIGGTGTAAGSAGGGVGVGIGGNGGPDVDFDSGGGGGGGYTGGGGGGSTPGSSQTGAGGGGGSSYYRSTSPTVAATAPTVISGSGAAATAGGAVNGAAGSAAIDWIPCVYQLSVSKSASPAPVNAGARTIWTVAVANSGPDPMTRGDTISLADTLPAGPIGSPTPTFRVLTIATSGTGTDTNLDSGAMTCTGVTVGASMPSSTVCSRPYSALLAPGAPIGGVRGLNSGETLTITYEQIFANTATATSITNVASTVDRSSTTGTTDIIGVNANRSGSGSVSILPYDLQVTKSASAATIGAGQAFTWTINVTNNGPGDMQGPNETAANPLVVSDAAPTTNVSTPASFTSSGPATGCTYVTPFNTINCTSGLASGQTQTFTFQQTVNAGAPGNAVISNTASVTDYTTAGGEGSDSSAASITVSAADLAVTKTDGVTSVDANGTTSYTVVVTNNGPSSVTGAILTDAAASGLSKTSVACAAAPGQCTAGTTPSVAQLEAGYALPALASGQTYRLTVNVNVTALSGTVSNIATIAAPSGTSDPTPANNSATDTNSVTPVADLAVTKTNGVTSVNAGGTTSYTITVTNGGPSSVTGATLTDAAATGLSKTSIACSATPGQCTAGTTPTIAQLEAGYALPALASGQTYQLTVVASVTATSGSVSNIATIAAPGGTTDPGAGNNSATDTDTVTPVADLSVTKTDGVASVNAGGTTTYTVTVTNGGPSSVTGATLTDAVAAGLTKTSVVCSATPGQCVSAPSVASLEAGFALPALASGQTYQLTIVANVTATSGSVANTATIAVPSGTTDPGAGNNSATDTDTVNPVADLAVTKTNGVTSVNAGGTTSYTITVTNGGPSPVTGATLTDAAVAGLTKTSVVCSATPGQCVSAPSVASLEAGFALPALASGQTYQITVAASVTATSGSVANTATIAVPSGTSDPGAGNNSATDTDAVTPSADLSITKTNGATSVNAGGTTSYTITVTNGGPSSVTGATLADPAVAGLTKTSVVCSATPGQCVSAPSVASLESGFGLPALASGQTYQITVAANVTATSGSVANAATVAVPSGTTDPGAGNNSATDTDTVTPVADLSITKTDGVASVNAGGTTTYTVTVTNGGPSSVTGGTLTDAVATGLTKTSVVCSATPGQCVSAPSIASLEAGFTLPALASGQTYQLTIAANVTATSGSVANTATIAVPSGTNDPGAGNNSATDTDTVNPVADLSITKTNGATSVNAGGTTSYTITVTNGGPSSVTGATLADPAVAGLTKTSVVCSATPGQCVSAPSVASLESGFALPALASGQTYQITVAASVTVLSGSVANTATVAVPSGTTDPGAGNNSATDTDTVTPVADLSITKTDGVSSVDAGGTTSYTVTVTNGGPSSVTGATLADPAVAGLTKTSVVCSGTPGQCVTAPSVASLEAGFALPALASGQTYQITVAANVTATSGNVANTATIEVPSGTTDPGAGNNSATDTNTVTPVADLAVTKTNGVSSVTALGTTSYTVTVINNGPSAVTGATLTDPVASGLTVTSVACSATPGQCALLSTPTIIQLQAGYALPTLASGQTYQLTVNATVTATSGSVANTATIAVPSGTTDPTGGNNSATDTDTVAGVADLAVTKTDGVTSVNAGGTTSYTVTVTNIGPSSVTGATLTDPVATGLTVTSVACAAVPGQCTAGTTPTIAQLQAGYALPALALGQTYVLTVNASVTATSGSVANTATIAVPSGVSDPVSGNDSATDTNTVTPVSELAITKTNGVSVLDAGGTTTYTITVTNNGPSTATGATLTDPAVSGLTISSIACSGTPGQCTAGTTPTTAELQTGYALPALASGQTYQLLVTFNVAATGGSVSNVATVAPPAGTLDLDLTNNIATDADTVTPVADLSVTKTNGVSSVDAGGTTSYTITITNGGPSPVTGATLTDAPVAGLTKTSVVCSATPGQCSSAPSVASLEAGFALPALASGQTYQLTVSANVTATSGSVANTATVAAPSGTTDPIAGNNSATDTDTVTPVADLAVTKTNGAASVNAGGTTSYTVTVTNNGPSPVTGAILTDAAAAGLTKTSVVCSATPGQCSSAPSVASLEAGFALPALASGQTYQLTVAASVTATSGSVANTASVAPPSGTIDPTPANDSATDTDTVTPVADLSITKTNGASSVNAGGTTSYTVTVTNGGPSSVTGATLADPAVAGLSKTSVVCSATPGQCSSAPSVASLEAGFALPALASGATYQLTVMVSVTATSGSVANTATIAVPSGTIDPAAANDSATDTDTVTPVADLAVTKTNGATSVNAGGTTTYTVTVTNNGPSSVTGATLADPAVAGLAKTSVGCSATPGQCSSAPSVASLEAGYALPALASGQTYQLTIVANVTATSGNVANAASVAPPSGTIDPTPANDSATDTDTVTPIADLAITKTNGAANVSAGGTTIYTVTVTNNGPSAATGATLTDPAVSGLTVTAVSCSATPGQCTAGTTPTVAALQGGYALPALATGQTYQIEVVATVTAISGSVANTASVAPPSGTIDPTPANDSATDTDAITPVADLSITKTNGASSVNAGGATTYTITVTNNGPSSVTGATLNDPTVAGLTVTSIACSATPGQCAAAPTIAQLQGGFALPALASGQAYQIDVSATVTATSGSVANTVSIAPPSGTIDPTPANDNATDTDTVTPVADLAVTKTDGVASVNAGGTTTYTVTVTNGGPSSVVGATLTDAAATGLTKTSVACSATPGQCVSAPSVASLEAGVALPALASGQMYQITVSANVTATSGSVANTATVAVPSGTTDPGAGNNSATDTNTVNPIANLVTVKTRTSASATPSVGDTVTFQIAVTNNGPSAATNVSLTDMLPAGLTATGANGTVSQGAYVAGTGVWTVGSLANGVTATLTLSGTVNTGQGGLAITNTTTAATTADQPDPTTTGDDLNETVNVFLPAIVAANDSVGGVNGASGAANVLNAFTGDTLNGAPATAVNTTLTVASGFSVPAGLMLDTATGNVSVTAGTAAGTYTFDYTICEIANPANCDNGTISVTVVAAPIVAANDSVGGVNGANGGTNVLNAFTGDTVNGAPATAANTTLTVASGFSVPAGLTFDTATGNVSVTAGTAAGTYTFDYTICETLNPANCDNGTISVTVVAAPIVAADDSVGGVNGASGAANVLNAYTGDTLNGVAATAANTTLTVASGFSVPAGVTFDTATGNVSVVAGTAAGTYAFDYTICEILNPTNCDNGTISVTVVAAAIVAADDSVVGVNGASGAANVLNAFAGDMLNGVAATAANTTLTVASGFSVPAGLTFDTATGNVSVVAGTAAGTYTFDYTICENLNPANCDNGTISVTVVAAPIVANNDTPPAVVSGIGNANLINAFANDTLNGAAVNVAAITATVTVPASNPGVSLDTAIGVVSVAAGVPAGDYTIQYQICETLNPTNCSSGTIFVHVDAAVSAVTGTVYTDSNGNQTLDTGEPRQPNWIVEIFRNGTLVGTTTTNSTGDYTFTGLTSGPGYSIQFRNPENSVVFDVITGLTLADNVTVVDQNLPIDPSGVVYDSLTRNPVAGAVLTMVDGGGAPLPAACFLSATQQGQQTGASGQYQFDIIPGAAAQCPVGETVYRIVVTPPAGYSSPSTVLVPQAGPFDPTGLPSPALVGSSASAPAVGDPTVYYLTFRLASGDPDVIFNHIPIDPFLGRPPLTVSKTSIKRTASVGDLVPYTITVRNAEAVQRAGVTVVDILPPGFKYVPGSATVNGVPGEPTVADRELTWTNQIIPANGSVVYKIVLVIGAGVTGGDRVNTALARNGADNSEISNRGQAVVAIVASTVFDCSEIIGKVFDDRNGNGYQDEGEPGIPAARLATVNGLLVTTDEFGRYHITCVAVPDARIGSNFVLKLDPRSVPAGYAPTIDNPQSIRLTRGKMSELNFGVKKADVREVNLDARAFVASGTALKPELAAKLKLLAAGNPQPLVVRVNYRLGANEDAGVADVRLAQLKAEIEACFGPAWDEARPVVEMDMNRADGEQTP
ncbi:MAG: SdrD B-like domain-containing protein [Micropepsaceae bacterium]